MHKQINSVVELKAFACDFWIIDNWHPMINNLDDLFMHFLTMSREGQVAMDMVVMNKFSSSVETQT
jgi:hypothetical protein